MNGPSKPLDVVVFGGGAAGLWLLDVLSDRGYAALLLEADRLGTGQTVCAQGIIHGGLKYTLDGVLSRSAASMGDMPMIWRESLAGRQHPNLGKTRLRADHCHLWRTTSVRSRLAMIGARVGLRVAPEPVAAAEIPDALSGCPGSVARLAEPVIDPVSFLADLAAQHRERILRVDRKPEMSVAGAGRVAAIVLKGPDGAGVTLRPGHVVFTAGAGNEALCEAAGMPQTAVRRPLHMLMARGQLPDLNGHCVDGARTRVTITSDTDDAGRRVWQVGGQVAEDGVEMTPAPFVRHAVGEVRAVLPGLDLSDVEWASYRIDRAEARGAGARPDDVAMIAQGNVIAAWPTKLALAPRLAERVVARLGPPTTPLDPEGLEPWPRPGVARPPWETQQKWYRDV